MRSLRRTLAVRFAATMALGLTAISSAIWWTAHEHITPPALIAASLIVILGAGATLIGAWRVAGAAVQPVLQIAEQATHIEAGTLDQRISTYATTREFRGLVAVLNRMLDRLSEAFGAQRRFTSDVSHELRTPLTALRGEIEVALRSDRGPHEYRRVLQSALEEIDRMTSMTEELLLINRAESGLIALQREPTDLNGLVDVSLDRLKSEITVKQLTVERELTPSLAQPPLDRALVQQLIDELVENAVQYSDRRGRIRVVTGRVVEGLRLTVENSGTGIALQELPHIFDPFYRVDRARSRGTGTGLGLTLAAAIARLHGGQIRFSKQDDDDVCVEVDLPVPGRA
jgi:two-component system heavy metal sensor histidine kinase CusS